MLAEYGPWIIAWCFFALCCGGFIKGALGVGTPLLTVPMMAQVLPPQTAIAIMAIPVVVANLWQFAQAERSTAVVARFWPTFLAILAGTWVGVKILSVIDEQTLMILVGVAVIAFALLQGSRFRLHLPDALVKPAGVLFGGAAGLIGGVSSFFGPMLITYLISIRGLGKNQFVSSISFLYVSAVVPWTIALYLYGILDQRLLLYSTLATIPVTIGLLLGQRIRHSISDARFQYLIIGILMVSGISMLWRAYH
ncbi:MAG: sulfite exporter TauE/SafE family protein [Gammaproteobacteria bacterium]|nr:sulfite exporter TauE/SafE family protein [Gammaproteobacteria bacterium]MDH3536649.1 sulfite exporter TauE/SafE family protein [Gammaproteobacteria bacterium]